MKTITLILTLFLVIGCTEVKEIQPEPTINTLKSCDSDSDCVPLPGCHPRECINFEYEGNYEKPEICTMMFDDQAAYRAEDCVCVENICVNDNLNNEINPVLNMICNSEVEGIEDYGDGDVFKCGDYYKKTPQENLMDAPRILFDMGGNKIVYCGGMPKPSPTKDSKLCDIECEEVNLC